MGFEVIDGTVEAAALKRSTAKVAMYDRIVIRTADGSERRLEKVAVSPSVSGMIEPGTLGRFYGYKAITATRRSTIAACSAPAPATGARGSPSRPATRS